MKVILPVAGTGTRLRPFTLHLPKCLLPIAGKTLLDHIIDSFKDLKSFDWNSNLCYLVNKVANIAKEIRISV